MSRYTIVLLGLLLAGMVTVYAEHNGSCHRDNESLHLCGKLCEPTCKDANPDPRLCPRIPCTKFTAACRCDSGYVRDTDGSCVVRTDCQNNQDQDEQDSLKSAE